MNAQSYSLFHELEAFTSMPPYLEDAEGAVCGSHSKYG